MRAWIGVLLVVGCGSSSPFPSDDIAAPFDGNFDSTIPKEAGTFDVVQEADATKFNGGGPFTCIDCICDGTLNVCQHISGGNVMSGDAGAPTCDPDGGQPYCAAIAIDCLPKPSCACVLQSYPAGCTCDVDPSGNGLVVTCAFP